MPKPARLYPKEEPMDPNPKMIFIGSMILCCSSRLDWNSNKHRRIINQSSQNFQGDKMVKAELIEEPQVSQETELVKVDNVPDVDVAIEQWDAYQRLCKGLLNDTDYQEIIVKEKDEEGNYVKVKRHFKKKSAWQKLSRAFNVDTAIVDRDLERTKTGRIKEAYYCVRATLPNGRSVESDALCSRSEKGKDKVSDHTIMSTAKTRATNRAIAELIGAGEVSAEEMSAERIVNQSKFLKEDNI